MPSLKSVMAKLFN